MEDFKTWQGILLLAFIALSLLAWIPIILRWQRDGCAIAYTPRHPVPWGSGAIFLSLFFVVMAVGNALAPPPLVDAVAPAAEELKTPLQYLLTVSLNAAVFLSIVGCGGFWLMNARGANFRDLGLPTTRRQALTDAALGVRTAMLMIGPLLGIMLILSSLFKTQSQNPVLLRLAEDNNGAMFLAAFISAVILAPILEEFTFRLLLQGFLERAEDELLEWRSQDPLSDRFQGQKEGGEILATDGPSPMADSPEPENESDILDDQNPYASPKSVPTVIRLGELPEPDANPPEMSFAGLPYGWGPILISAMAFSVAHLGNGPDPIPLFLFGMIIGYVYQRTHRILPCIACHMAFNAFSLAMTYLTVGGS